MGGPINVRQTILKTVVYRLFKSIYGHHYWELNNPMSIQYEFPSLIAHNMLVFVRISSMPVLTQKTDKTQPINRNYFK